MLQQTVVKSVIPFYEKFLKKWPNLNSFKNASLEEILFIWQGLGYYQRAKNLFKAKEFLNFIEDYVGVKISLISNGPNREDLIHR